jgi:hypothetical protein
MASPDSPEGFMHLDMVHGKRRMDLFVESTVMQKLDPLATEMYFVADLSRRYKLLFDQPVGLFVASWLRGKEA